MFSLLKKREEKKEKVVNAILQQGEKTTSKNTSNYILQQTNLK